MTSGCSCECFEQCSTNSLNSFSFSTFSTCVSFFALANGDCVMCVGAGAGWLFTGVFKCCAVACEQDADVEAASSSSSSRITMLSITAPAIRKGGERICWGVTNVEVSGLHFNYTKHLKTYQWLFIALSYLGSVITMMWTTIKDERIIEISQENVFYFIFLITLISYIYDA